MGSSDPARSTFVKSIASAAVLLSAALGVYRLGLVVAETADRSLFDAPRGAWLATVREDAVVSVVEEREGWRLVRLEGWMPVSAQSAGARPGAAEAPGRAAAGAGALVRGVLLPDPEWPPGIATSGLVVLLLADLEALDREHAAAGDACRARVATDRARTDRLQVEMDGAFHSSDNFREAAGRYDRLKQQVETASREGEEHVADCRKRADAILQKHAAKRAVSDASGSFEFPGVPPGRYRVVALAGEETGPRHWSMEFVVAGSETKVLDTIRDRSPFLPRWDLRAAPSPGHT